MSRGIARPLQRGWIARGRAMLLNQHQLCHDRPFAELDAHYL